MATKRHNCSRDPNRVVIASHLVLGTDVVIIERAISVDVATLPAVGFENRRQPQRGEPCAGEFACFARQSIPPPVLYSRSIDRSRDSMVGTRLEKSLKQHTHCMIPDESAWFKSRFSGRSDMVVFELDSIRASQRADVRRGHGSRLSRNRHVIL